MAHYMSYADHLLPQCLQCGLACLSSKIDVNPFDNINFAPFIIVKESALPARAVTSDLCLSASHFVRSWSVYAK